MHAVAIVGAGELGATTARAIAARGSADEIRLLDGSGTIAAGKALDIWQAGAIDGGRTRVIGSAAIDDAAGASVVVVADRPDGEWHGDAALEQVRRAAAVASRAPILFAGVRQHPLIALAARELRLPRRRLLGTAPEALASAVRALAALLADASAAEVSVPVLGISPQWVFAWSEAHVAGAPLTSVFSSPELARLEARAHASWPPGPYALGSAAAGAVHALLHGSARRFSIFALLDGEYGARHAVAAVPARLGPGGVQQVHTAELSVREQVAFQSAVFTR